jgi:hypothetical protein
MLKLARILIIAAALYLLLVLLDEFVLVILLGQRVGVPLIVALVEGLAAIGTGFIVRGLRGRVWRFDDPEARPDLALDLILGVPLVGTLCFLVSCLYLSSWTMTPLLVILGVAGAYAIARHFETKSRILERIGGSNFALAAIVLVFVCAAIAAQAPPSTLDELSYHLAIPWTWVKEHRAIELPLISHSYFPLGVESASLPLLSILGNRDGGIASHILHLVTAIATTIVIARRSRDLLLTAAIVATPALALTAGWSLVDWPLLGITVALIAALDDGDAPAIAAAVGAGMLTKYTFLPLAVIVVLTWVARSRGRAAEAPRDSATPRPRDLRLALAIGCAIGSIFFLRNLVFTANPVAPFLSAGAPHVSGYRAPAFLSSYVFDGRYIDESLGASLLSFAAATGSPLGWVMLLFGAGALFALAPSARLLVPFFAVAAMQARALAANRVLRGIAATAIAAQLLLIGFLTERSDAFSLLAARATDEQYLTKARPSIPVARALDAALPAESLTLVVGLNETYWFVHRVRGGGNFDGPRLSTYLTAPTPEAVYARLKRDGITHVAVVSVPAPTLVAKKVEERDTALTPEAQRALAITLDHYAANVTTPGSATALFALK